MKVVLLTGVPASGKTFLAEKVKNFKLVDFGGLMLKEAKKLGFKVSRDELRKKISLKQYKIIQEKVALEINKISEKQDVLINTHLTIKHGNEFIEGIPDNIAKILKIGLIILVEASEEDISKRRKLSKDRSRDKETKEEIGDQQKLNKYLAKKICDKFNCKMEVIFNKDIKKASQELVNMLK